MAVQITDEGNSVLVVIDAPSEHGFHPQRYNFNKRSTDVSVGIKGPNGNEFFIEDSIRDWVFNYTEVSVPAVGSAEALRVLVVAMLNNLPAPAPPVGGATAANQVIEIGHLSDIEDNQTNGTQRTHITDGVDDALVTAAGELNVLATAQPGVDIGDVTVNNGAGAAAVNVQDGGNSITVDAVDLDIRNLVFATDKVDVSGSVIVASFPAGASTEAKQDVQIANQTNGTQRTHITDGVDDALVTAAGELNVLSTPQPGVDVGDVTVNNAAGAAAVNIQDGGNSITVDAVDLDIRNLVFATDKVDVSGSTISTTLPAGAATEAKQDIQIANQTNGTQRTHITDGVDDALVTAAGELNVLSTAQPGVDVGDVTVNNGAGAAAVNVQDGGNSITVDAVDLDIRNLVFATDKVDVSGSTVTASAQPGVDIGDVTVNNAAGASAVNVQDGGNSITVDAVDLDIRNLVFATDKVDVSGSMIQGDVASDAADAGNPVKIGGIARTSSITPVSNADRVNATFDKQGKQIVEPYSIPELAISGLTASMTGTGNTSVIAAQGAGTRLQITHIIVTNGHATVGTYVNIKDGTTTIYTLYAAALGGGASIPLPKPLRLSDNTALQAANETTGSDVRVSASGYIGS